MNDGFYLKALKTHQLEFGNFYFFDKYVISEINEGVFFNWKKAEVVIDLVIDFYENNFKVYYISNRKNRYYINPADWLNFKKTKHHIKTYLIVHNNTNSSFNLEFEKMFYKAKTTNFYSLEEAIGYVEKQENTELQ